jgi:hypothetical protein
LRPYEFHAERLDRDGLKWEAINWEDKSVHVEWQKDQSKATRDVPLNNNVLKWLLPFKGLLAIAGLALTVNRFD